MGTKPSTEQQRIRRQSSISNHDKELSSSRSLTRMNSDPRRATFAQAIARYYIPNTQHLTTSHRDRNFARLSKISGDQIPRTMINRDELRRFSLVQVNINFIF